MPAALLDGPPSVGAAGWPSGLPLRLEGVAVTRGAAHLLDGLDLTFEPGRRYVLIGPSGAGKSTLLRLLNRLEDPADGRVTVGGIDLKTIPPRVVRSAVGLVFQAPRPLPGSVAENLAYASRARGQRVPAPEAMASALEEVGLDPRALKREAEALSGGERQRLALAAALALGPEILALDEPTSALDPASARRVADLLAERWASTGLRTIAVTHHRGHAPMLGDTAVILERGRVAAVGPMGEVIASPRAAGLDP